MLTFYIILPGFVCGGGGGLVTLYVTNLQLVVYVLRLLAIREQLIQMTF